MKRCENLFVYGILMGEAGAKQAVLKDHVKRVGIGGFFTVDYVEGDSVIGELIQNVNEEMLSYYDRIEGYPNFYNRKIVTVKSDNKYYKAWVYYQN